MSPPSSEQSATGGVSDPDSDESAPATGVDSRWWYWIAAVPAYFLVSLFVGVVAFGIVLTGLFLGDLGPIAVLAFLLALGAVPGLVLTVAFPLAMYLDAEAVSDADVDWEPDPVLYGLVAVAGVITTAFVVSVPLALYYLYRRHEAVGVP